MTEPKPKSSEVISKSYRVRELPPPPKVAPAASIRQEVIQPKTIELDSLVIDTEKVGSLFRNRIRMSPRWEQWLANPVRRERVGYGLSILVHLIVLTALAFWITRLPRRDPSDEAGEMASPSIASSDQSAPPDLIAEPLVEQLGEQLVIPIAVNVTVPVNKVASLTPPPKPPNVPMPQPKPQVKNEPPPATAKQPPSSATTLPGEPADAKGPSADLVASIDKFMEGRFKRRTPKNRTEAARYGGGSQQSEEAVERGLRWLVAHQKADGSWSCNHQTDACMHYCLNPGSEASSTAATGLALLPFLGAGYTHQQGEYQDVVQRGLDFLIGKGLVISYGTDFRDSSMYGQALATVALCEAYGMTQDEKLKVAAQGGLDYIAYVQDHNGGGWRYNPGEPGDTTVTGWMIVAMKSGQMARLDVHSPALQGAEKFLDSVQSPDGSQYGYDSRKPRNTTSAVGLLCRMYGGWKRDKAGLIQGVANLSKLGPSNEDMYFNYYTTQVLFHWSGPEWNAWNLKMRDYLISTQAREGHPAGSWFFRSQQSDAGGRLYNTAVATMILEVYYRFMPLYGEKAVAGK